MASTLQNAFTRTLGSLSKTSSIKQIFSHGSLYFGIFIYTAIGAKVGDKWMFHYTARSPEWQCDEMFVTFCDTCDDFVTPQVFQLLELPAETEKLETHQALLLTQRAILLQSIYNSSSDPGDNITAFKEVITDIWMGTKHPRHVILRNSLRRWHNMRRFAVRPPPPVLISSVRSSLTTGITSSPASLPSPSWPQSVPLLKGNLEWVRTFCAGYGNFAVETFEGRFFCLFFGIIGIPFMLSVLADVGGIFAGILQLAWDKNKTRLILIARKLHLLKPGYKLQF